MFSLQKSNFCLQFLWTTLSQYAKKIYLGVTYSGVPQSSKWRNDFENWMALVLYLSTACLKLWQRTGAVSENKENLESRLHTDIAGVVEIWSVAQSHLGKGLNPSGCAAEVRSSSAGATEVVCGQGCADDLFPSGCEPSRGESRKVGRAISRCSRPSWHQETRVHLVSDPELARYTILLYLNRHGRRSCKTQWGPSRDALDSDCEGWGKLAGRTSRN